MKTLKQFSAANPSTFQKEKAIYEAKKLAANLDKNGNDFKSLNQLMKMHVAKTLPSDIEMGFDHLSD